MFLGTAAAAAAIPFARLNAWGRNGLAGAAIDSPNNDGVSPRNFGAVGDGKTDDRAAVIAAITHAVDRGHPVDGGDVEYGVAGDISLSSRVRPHIRKLRLRQLSPGANRNTLGFTDCQQIRIDSLRIHLGSSKTSGSMDTTTGLKIVGGSRHRIKDVELTGDGKVTYVLFWGCSDSVFENIQVHDGQFEDHEMDPAGFRVPDDVVQGIHIADCRDCTLVNPMVRDLTGNATYFDIEKVVRPYANLRTRGIAGGGNTNITIMNPRIVNVDQGIDFSGNGSGWGNGGVQIIGGTTFNCGSVGVKLANAAQRCKVVGHTAENCGMMGFLSSGRDPSLKGFDNEFIGCTAINPGYNNIHNDSDGEPLAHAGFHVREDAAGGCEGVRIVDCRAIDRQGFYLAGDDKEDWPRAGATSAAMAVAWSGFTGLYSITFNTGETRSAMLTTGSTAVTWSGGLTSAVTQPFVSRPPRMAFGFLNETGFTGGAPNTIDQGCRSSGHLVAHDKGFHRDICHVTGGRAQTIATNKITPVEFFAEVDDSMGMHGVSSDEERIYPRRPGRYRVEGLVSFASSPNGHRRVEVRKNARTQQAFPFAAVVGDRTACPFRCEIGFSAADVADNSYIDIAGSHTAARDGIGVSLNLAPDRWLKVEMVKPL